VAYPILSRWCWNQEGWLKAMGYSDVSGSGVIHLYSGACGFVSAWVIGPRSGRFPSAQGDPQGSSILPAHSLPVPHNYLMIFIFPRNPLMNIP
jgi:Amt family ammonium transporter